MTAIALVRRHVSTPRPVGTLHRTSDKLDKGDRARGMGTACREREAYAALGRPLWTKVGPVDNTHEITGIRRDLRHQ